MYFESFNSISAFNFKSEKIEYHVTLMTYKEVNTISCLQ